MLTKRELLRLLEAMGINGISSKQLWDWEKERLIPPGEVRPVREGRGRTKYYPDGTEDQVAAVYRALQSVRSYRAARWLVWLDGYDTNVKRLFRDLLDEVIQVKGALEVYREVNLGGSIPDSYKYWPDKMAEQHDLPPMLRKARKRIGRDNFPALVVLLSYAWIPGNEPLLDEETAYEVGIFEKALDQFIPIETTDTGQIYNWLSGFREHLDIERLSEILANATEEQLRGAFQDMYFLFAFLSFVYVALAFVFEGRRVKPLPDLRSRDIGTQVGLTLIWLSLKQDADIRDKFDKLKDFAGAIMKIQ